MRKHATESELWIKANDFANEMNSHNVIEKDLTKQNQISKEHVDNNNKQALHYLVSNRP